MENVCRMSPAWDMNGDGLVTISDLGNLFKELLAIPARLLINGLHGTSIGNFFEISYYTCSGNFMGTVSVVFWIVAFYIGVMLLVFLDDIKY